MFIVIVQFKSFWYILDSNLLSNMVCMIILPQLLPCLSILLTVFFFGAEKFNLNEDQVIMDYTFNVLSKD